MDLRDYVSTKRNEIDTDAYVNSMLDRMGLQKKSDSGSMVFSALGIFSAGLAVGATLGLLFAPKPGPEIRRDVTSRFSSHDVRPNGASDRAKVPSSSNSEQTSHATTGG